MHEGFVQVMLPGCTGDDVDAGVRVGAAAELDWVGRELRLASLHVEQGAVLRLRWERRRVHNNHPTTLSSQR
jgi:hypothetical protein